MYTLFKKQLRSVCMAAIMALPYTYPALQAQNNLIPNGDFEDMSHCPGIPANQQYYQAFRGCLGTQWHVFNGSPDVHVNGGFQYSSIVPTAHSGNRFVHVYHEVNSIPGSNQFKRQGEAFYCDVNLQPGHTYTISFYAQTVGGAAVDNFYVLATNGLTQPPVQTTPYYLPNISSLPPYKVIINKVNFTSSGWQLITATFTVNQPYTQLLFLPYQAERQPIRSGHLLIDGVTATTPSKIYFDLPAEVCGCDGLVMDARQTVNSNNPNYFIEIFEASPNHLNGYFSRWYSGSPGEINLCSLYNFSCDPSLGHRVYRIKLAIHDPVNGWMEMVRYVTVRCQPQITILPQYQVTTFPGQSVTFTAAPNNPSYTYEWYLNPVSPSNLVGTGSTLTVNHSSPGTYRYILIVKDGCTGCSSQYKATVIVRGRIRPDGTLSQADTLLSPDSVYIHEYVYSGPKTDSQVKPLTVATLAAWDAYNRQIAVYSPEMNDLTATVYSGKKIVAQVPLSREVNLNYIPVFDELKGTVLIEISKSGKVLYTGKMEIK